MDNEFAFSPLPGGIFTIPKTGLRIKVETDHNSPAGAATCYKLVIDHEINGFKEYYFQNNTEFALYYTNGLIPALGVGVVDFKNKPLYTRDFPLNTGAGPIKFVVNASPGGGTFLGSADIRDVGLVSISNFDFGVVPINLSIQGNRLLVSTLFNNGKIPGINWYS